MGELCKALEGSENTTAGSDHITVAALRNPPNTANSALLDTYNKIWEMETLDYHPNTETGETTGVDVLDINILDIEPMQYPGTHSCRRNHLAT